MKLLIVDDSASARMMVRSEMEQIPGVQIVEAKNGKEGIEKAITFAPDVITMDMDMPEMDGLEAIARIRYYPQCSHIPIIVITTKTDIDTSKRAFQAGAIEFMIKPFTPGTLRQYIETALSPGQEFGGIRILVADDARAIRTIVSRILEKRGATVFSVTNGEEAVECLQKEEIDLIITDFVMPKMDGIELCRYVRTAMSRPDLPIIVITSAGEYSVAIEALKAGADDYLTKPFSRQELQARIKNHIRLIRYHQKNISIQQQLIQSAKMASLGEMSAGVAHELNNPLAVIKLATTEVKDLVEDKEYEELPEVLERMDRNINRCTAIVHHLRTFGHDAKDQGKEEESLNEIVKSALQFFEQQLKVHQITLSTELSESLSPVKCNALQIEQVIINLVGNARDSFEENAANPEITLRSFEKSDWKVLEVCDNGQGIPQKNIEQIFDPFFTTKPVGKGTGLGLSISHSIIEDHEGKLEVKSKEGQGTTFSLFLPVS